MPSELPGQSRQSDAHGGAKGYGETALLLKAADLAAQHGFVPVRTTCGPATLDNIIDLLQRNGADYVEEVFTKKNAGKKPKPR